MSLFENVDLKTVNWKQTIIVHLWRSFFAGIVWGIIVLILSRGDISSGWWAYPLLFPITFIFMMPAYYITSKICVTFMGDMGQMGVNLITLCFALFIAVGDPGVYFLHKNRPELVPVERFKFINLTMVLFVVDSASESYA